MSTAMQGMVGHRSTVGISAQQTLYVTNLNDKINKHELRMALYTIFTTYGTVLDVVALKTMKMRGQAHIVFRDVNSAGAAMRALQGFNFFDKEMVRFYTIIPIPGRHIVEP